MHPGVFGVVGQRHADAMGIGERLVLVQCLFQQGPEFEVLEGEGQSAGEQFFHVEQVVDQHPQALAVLVGDGDQVAGRFGQRAGGAAVEQADGAGDGGQRGAQFVADGGLSTPASCARPA
jgi:hypothetical protein